MRKENIQNIIFDLGGVLLNIDYAKTITAFKQLGLRNPQEAFSKESQAMIFRQLERGEIDENTFIRGLQQEIPMATRNELLDAWCALLEDFPTERFELLTDLKSRYSLYLLSNTNAIHQAKFERHIHEKFQWKHFANLFKFIGYSHRMGARKPDEEIFQLLMKKNGLNAENTMFIDDTEEHTLTARRLGLTSYHLKPGEEISDLLRAW